jgi:hypothetical protein
MPENCIHASTATLRRCIQDRQGGKRPNQRHAVLTTHIARRKRPSRTAARRTFSLTPCITPRNAAYRCSPMPTETRRSVTGLEIAGLRISKVHRSAAFVSIQAVRRVRSAGSSSTAKGLVIRPRVPATSVVRARYRPWLRKQATILGVSSSSTRQ